MRNTDRRRPCACRLLIHALLGNVSTRTRMHTHQLNVYVRLYKTDVRQYTSHSLSFFLSARRRLRHLLLHQLVS